MWGSPENLFRRASYSSYRHPPTIPDATSFSPTLNQLTNNAPQLLRAIFKDLFFLVVSPQDIYIYAVESKLGPKFGFFWVKTWSKVASKLGPRFFFCLFFPKFIVFFGYLKKTQIVCRGAKIIFWQFVRVSKKGFSKKNVHFLFLSFLCWRKKKRKREKNGKIKFQKKNRKIVIFGCLWRKLVFFVKMSFF